MYVCILAREIYTAIYALYGEREMLVYMCILVAIYNSNRRIEMETDTEIERPRERGREKASGIRVRATASS